MMDQHNVAHTVFVKCWQYGAVHILSFGSDNEARHSWWEDWWNFGENVC